MGLESFKTDGPRSSNHKYSGTSSDSNCIHVANSVDIEEVNIPAKIKTHDVEYLEIIKADEGQTANIVCTCMECNLVATSYETMVKVDGLDLQDADWYSEFKRIAIEQAPAKPTEGHNEDIAGVPDTDKDDEPDSGLMSFKS